MRPLWPCLVAASLLAGACTTPTAPTVVERGTIPPPSAQPPAPSGGDSGHSPSLPAPETVLRTVPIDPSRFPRVPTPATPVAPVPACAVSQADVDHARRILRLLTDRLQYGVPLTFSFEEYPFTSPRLLHGRLSHGPAGSLETQLAFSMLKNTLRFPDPQTAGYALWDASGQLGIVADLYVNGVKVQGCTARTGKIAGRIDLDGL